MNKNVHFYNPVHTINFPLLNKRFNNRVIYFSSILFILFIIFYREPMAASDTFKYIQSIEGGENS